MNVLYDYQIIQSQKYGGISRYYYELIKAIKRAGSAHTDIRCLFAINKYFGDELDNKFHKDIGKTKRGKISLNKLYFKILLSTKKYDVFHPTYYDPYYIGHVKGKVVITVHDMIPELFPEYYGTDFSENKDKAKVIHAADHIIAISESTKKDIMTLYPDIDSDKISVIYHGSSLKKTEITTTRESFPEKYILFVGNRWAYKNYSRFWQAVKPLLESDESLHLVCIGGGKFTDEENTYHGNCADRVMQMDASDEALVYAYSHAVCFVFPSLYEGFGIPTLEAFECECPVVLSNTSSMPEVGGDAVEYIDPYNVDDIRRGIQKVLTDSDLRKDMVERGKAQLSKFDWDDVAKKVIECYKTVTNS